MLCIHSLVMVSDAWCFMSKLKHTPGPFHIYIENVIEGSSEEMEKLTFKTEAEVELYRRLIASAPEMLEVLIKLSNEICAQGAYGDAENLSLINSAIAKAIGEAT